MNRRTFLSTSAAALAAPAILRGTAQAQAFPTRPVRMVIGFPPGGGSDQVGRPLAARMPDVLGQQIVVENRGGANGNLALEHTARSPADGYTICHVNNSVIAINPLLYKNLPFDVLRDFEPLGTVTLGGLIITVPATLPVRTLPEFVAYARDRPGQLNFGSGGQGSITHLGFELFVRSAGLNIVHVPYRGSAPALQDMLGGSIHLMVDGVNVSKAMLDAGRVRALAFLGPQRHPLMPDLPTAVEQGYPAVLVGGWQGFVAPARTPPAVLDRLEASLKYAVEHGEVQRVFSAGGTMGAFQDRQTMARLIRDELTRWRPIIADLGLTLE
ncbi:Bug family tripartite tricarboxylate transporter substrate binding protein [Elioraea rosea]|uniref:Bug family tripartite tricarboxylate transporter substrate binding protein n=1 Tax=Elioraea rosea TaxID=2492390 RepID=UPI001184D285|nr:tripartite tricarboxylate transporter substrate binding protein [Elioraea rosea]